MPMTSGQCLRAWFALYSAESVTQTVRPQSRMHLAESARERRCYVAGSTHLNCHKSITLFLTVPGAKRLYPAAKQNYSRSDHGRENLGKKLYRQGRIKGFVGPRHFSSLGPFGDSKTIVGTTLYSRLSGLMKGKRMH
jgi:hypothetical protein